MNHDLELAIGLLMGLCWLFGPIVIGIYYSRKKRQ